MNNKKIKNLSRCVSVVLISLILFSPCFIYSEQSTYAWKRQSEGLTDNFNISAMTCFDRYAILGTKDEEDHLNKENVWFSSLSKGNSLKWQSVSKGVESKDILSICSWIVNKDKTFALVGTKNNGIYTINMENLINNPTNASWIRDLSGVPHVSSINCFFKTEKFLYAGSKGSLYQLASGVFTWTPLLLKEGTADFYVDIFDVHTNNHTTFLLATNKGLYQGTLGKASDNTFVLSCIQLGDYSEKVYTILKNSDSTFLIGTSIGLMQLKEGKWEKLLTGLPEKPLLKIQSDLEDSSILNLVYRDQFIRIDSKSLSPLKETIESDQLSKKLSSFASIITPEGQKEQLLGDEHGNVLRWSPVQEKKESSPPVITISTPKKDEIINQNSTTLSATLTDKESDIDIESLICELMLNEKDISSEQKNNLTIKTVDDNSYAIQKELTDLKEGSYTIILSAKDKGGNEAKATRVFTVNLSHTFEFKLTNLITVTNQKLIKISGTLFVDGKTATDGTYFVSCNNKVKYPVSGEGYFNITDLSLEEEGMNKCTLQIYEQKSNLIPDDQILNKSNTFSVYYDSVAPVVTIQSIQYRYKKIYKEWKNTDLTTNSINMDDKALIIYGSIQDDSIADFSEEGPITFATLTINTTPIKLTFSTGKIIVPKEYQSGLIVTRDKTDRSIISFTLDNSKLEQPIIKIIKSPSAVLISIQAQDQAGNISDLPKLPLIYFSTNIYLKLTIGKNEVMEIIPENQLKLPLYAWTPFPSFLDVPPMIIKGRTMVPLRFIAEAFGAKVGWDAPIQEITIELKNLFITLYIKEKIAYITDTKNPNAKDIPLEASPILYHGRTLIPLRAIVEIFGAKVEWKADTKEIIIEYSDPAANPGIPVP
jgi:hypothetical protein